jgi:hypothetical protein
MAKKGKSYGTKIYPQNAKETSNLLSRMEPLITPEIMKSRYLHGVDISDYSEDELKQEIWLAVNEIELLLNVPVFPVQFKERHPYDYSHYNNFSHIKTQHRPIISLESYKIVSTNGVTIFSYPLEWVDAGYFFRGQINIVPLLTAFTESTRPTTGDPSGASIFLHAQMNQRWISGFYEIEYTAGLGDCEGNMPILVNDLIGLSASVEILSAKQNQFIHGSQSLGQDGVSQSSSLKNGGNIYQARIEMLTQRRQMILERMKMLLFNKYFLGHI